MQKDVNANEFRTVSDDACSLILIKKLKQVEGNSLHSCQTSRLTTKGDSSRIKVMEKSQGTSLHLQQSKKNFPKLIIMFKLTVFLALVAVVLAAPKPEPKPGFLAAPLISAAPLATSYANSYHLSYKAPLIASAPLIAPAPAIAYAAPIAVL
ncbi:uncharacterized protein LOC135173003 [Diachasmimorpha longicaudata]|uniref:uncharacterized protein LOC135173003 n=1 Tax=Diachasmimorpha longicaudata TaxID=58733 RepID=UPI0030B91185